MRQVASSSKRKGTKRRDLDMGLGMPGEAPILEGVEGEDDAGAGRRLTAEESGGEEKPDYRAQVIAFYTAHNPEKLVKVEKLLAHYKGNAAEPT